MCNEINLTDEDYLYLLKKKGLRDKKTILELYDNRISEANNHESK